MSNRNFEVLYTHQKQKKNKTWQDGFLQVSCNGTKAVLYDVERNALEVFHLQQHKVFTGSDVECDRYLISIGDEIEDVSANIVTRNLKEGNVAAAIGSQCSSWRKRKRQLSEDLRPDLPIPKQYSKANVNFRLDNNPPKAIANDRITSSTNGGMFNQGQRNRRLGGYATQDTRENLKCSLKNGNQITTETFVRPQKRNRGELLSLFSSKVQHYATPDKEQNPPWHTTARSDQNCLKSLDSYNVPNERAVFDITSGCPEYKRQNRNESNWNIQHGEKSSVFCSNRFAFGEPSTYGDSYSNVYQDLDCQLLDNCDKKAFGNTFVNGPKIKVSATSTCVLPNVFGVDEEFCLTDEQDVGTDHSELEAVDLFGSNVEDDLSFDICSRFEAPVHFSSNHDEQGWNSGTQVRSESVFDNNNQQFQESLVNNVVREPLKSKDYCSSGTRFLETRTSNCLRSRSFTSPLLSSVHSGLNISANKVRSSTDLGQATTSNSERFCRQSFSGELFFPSNQECFSSVSPTREVSIPTKFTSVMEYKQILKSALREHLNIILFELAKKYHGILSKVDIASSSDSLSDQKENINGPSCSHGPAKLRAVKKDGPNKGRHFYTCPGFGSSQCKFFKWADEDHTVSSSGNKKLPLTSSDSIRVYFKSKGAHFYYNCLLERRIQVPNARKYGKRFSRGGQRHSDLNYEKKSMYIVLKYRESSSSYSKDDIWIVSKTLSFEPNTSFVAKSLFFGPSSSGDLEIEPVSGYSPSNWKSGDTVHAIWACNAGTELSCMKNLDDYVTLQQMPLLPYLVNGSRPSYNSHRSTFTAPLGSSNNRHSLGLAWTVIEGETEKMITQFKLNKDQATALYACARMFLSDEEGTECSPVTLIHGVFGAGKSFLLAVVVLLMVKLFEISETSPEARSSSVNWKILISSTTNVAVDRILLGLLALDFDQFIRVGSVRKIAKPILPFSIHSVGSESQELKELQGMLKSDLTTSEKTYVRKSIERHKLGENRKRLANVRVVGVTCAACVFPSLEKLKFPVLLLDECSQMTEPASLLPMARFGCRKLVLVGDPKQLNPTIQGSESKHDVGLEQTLFDRFMKMDFEPILLRTQYRCHPRISSIANRLFYDGNLLDGVTTEDRKPVVDFLPTLCFYNVSKGKEECSQDGSYFNKNEAIFVVALIKSLLESEVDPTQIGVITQYKSQLATITNSLMSDEETSHKEFKGIQISTVDAFQGGEKDVIILSCVRTQHVGFIDCKRRTNVALTRAKRHLCIVGCGKMLSSNSLWGKIITFCRETKDGVQSSELFIRQWKERKPVVSDDISKKGEHPKEKKARCRKGNSSKTVVQPENNSPSHLDVSTPDVCIQIEKAQSSDSCDNSTECHEVQEIFFDAENVSTNEQTITISADENEVLLSEYELCFDPLMEEDLSEFDL